MALFKCRECGKRISDTAEMCSNCGAPVRAKPDIVSGRQVRTIEKTAKHWKGHMVLAILLGVAGIIVLMTSCGDTEQPNESGMWIGVACIAISVPWYFVTRIGAWWHHG